ncbi:MAG: hypothetical protein K6C08_00255 [Oscillospiraceae bacterium]|nr:hypothetical protein [Oscillospiraceae bacterium]
MKKTGHIITLVLLSAICLTAVGYSVSFREKLGQTAEKLSAAEALLKQREGELAGARAALEETEALYQSAEESLSATGESLKRKEAELAKAEAAYEELKALYETSEESLSTVGAALRQKETELATVRSELAEMERLKEQAEASLAEAEGSLELLQSEFEELQTEYENEIQMMTEGAAETEDADGPAEEESLLSEDWFDDAFFFGDSQTGALKEYVNQAGGLGDSEFFYLNGLSCYNLMTKGQTLYYEGQFLPAEELIRASGANKLFLLLALNDLGCSDEQLYRCWNMLLDRIRERNPELVIYVQSGTPLRYDLSYFNEDNIRRYNGILQNVCRDQGCVYVDIASSLTGEDGYLRPEYGRDQVHMNNAGCEAWVRCLFRQSTYSGPVSQTESAAGNG